MNLWKISTFMRFGMRASRVFAAGHKDLLIVAFSGRKDIMDKFQEGKTYNINGGGQIRVIKRTPHYITYTGTGPHGIAANGRRKVYPGDIFGLGEHVLLPAMWGPASHYFCFAGHVSE